MRSVVLRSAMRTLVGLMAAVAFVCPAFADPPDPPPEPEPLVEPEPPVPEPPPPVREPPPKPRATRPPAARPRPDPAPTPSGGRIEDGKASNHWGWLPAWLPSIGIAASTRVGALIGDTIESGGRFDIDESGFLFDFLEIGARARFGKVVALDASLLADLNGVVLDHAGIAIDHLPWNVAVRGGLLRSRVGFENARSPWQYAFPDQSPALGRMFGSLGFVFAGADLAFDIPAPWTLRPFFAASSAEGIGMTSFYGQSDVGVDAIRDLAWQAGLENSIRAGAVTLDIEFAAILGPNNTGRGNSADIFTFAIGVLYPEEGHPVGVRFETEWFVRRQQVPGRNIADTSGWALVELDFADDWEAGIRMDYAQKREASVLGEGDLDDLIRTTILVGYEPAPYLSFDLVAGIETGGLHDDIGYSVQLVARAGLLPEEGK